MSDWTEIETSPEVAAVLRAGHSLVVFGSYSAPEGDYYGDASEARMMTLWALPGTAYPILMQETRWPVGERDKAVTRNWLCVAVEQDD